ncbi:MAG: hypothetical protein IKS55_02660 [Oscillospiraceae bacterium]|nr:hypothetical protein [Oscillospiraceae bacterium]
MASFEVSNDLNQLWKAFEEQNLLDAKVEQEILEGCGDILVKKIKELFTGDWDTMETFSHVVCKPKVQRGKDGIPYVVVTVTGIRADGERYGTVAFVLNYGRREKYGHITGSHFWNRAIEETESEMQAHMEEVFTRKLKEKGLI